MPPSRMVVIIEIKLVSYVSGQSYCQKNEASVISKFWPSQSLPDKKRKGKVGPYWRSTVCTHLIGSTRKFGSKALVNARAKR